MKTVDSSSLLGFVQNILDHCINTFCIPNNLSVTNPHDNAHLPIQCGVVVTYHMNSLWLSYLIST